MSTNNPDAKPPEQAMTFTEGHGGIYVPPSSITFHNYSRVAMTLTADGRLEPGPGLSPDEATQGMFAALLNYWEAHRAKTSETVKERQ